MIYFDNNGTTKASPEAKKAMIKWIGKPSNPSSHSKDGKDAKELIEKFKKYILCHCGTDSSKYTVVITSGASESNSFILTSSVRAYQKLKRKIPHIVISAIEHKSIIETCENLHENGYVEYTMATPNKYGIIELDEVKKCLRKNTCLVSIMGANNELGSINNIKKIGALCHSKNIPFHSDCVQLFGKYKMDISKYNIDAMSVSFHKLYCSMGLGLLIINNKFINGYKLCAIISGAQQGGLRGGTENIPAIAGSYAGMKINFKCRESKNIELAKLSKYLLDKLGDAFIIVNADNKTISSPPKSNITIKILGPISQNDRIPNTLLISIIPKNGTFCNVKLKKYLCLHEIYISIGSACNASSPNASHVLTAIKATPSEKRGVVRISFGDYNTKSEIDRFLKVFIKGILKQF